MCSSMNIVMQVLKEFADRQDHREGVSSQCDTQDGSGSDDDSQKMPSDVDDMFTLIDQVEGNV